MTARDWCDQEKVTETHLYAVLKGDRQSAKLTAKIDAFIGEKLEGAA